MAPTCTHKQQNKKKKKKKEKKKAPLLSKVGNGTHLHPEAIKEKEKKEKNKELVLPFC
jgi:hypothetical protein